MGVEHPWDDEPLHTQILMHDPNQKEDFHKIDLFHTISLGMGKGFAASAVSILQEILPGSSIEQRMKEFSGMFLEYCRDSRLQSCSISIWLLFCFSFHLM
jgi:hypothetical protein